MHKKYEFLEHTADVKFRAYGASLEEAFGNAVAATCDIMTDVSKVKPVIEKKIKVSAKTKEALLYDFLEELLFLLDTEGFIGCEVREIKISGEYELEGVVVGDSADNYEVTTHIKSVTYSEMFIEEKDGAVTLQVVHDI